MRKYCIVTYIVQEQLIILAEKNKVRFLPDVIIPKKFQAE